MAQHPSSGLVAQELRSTRGSRGAAPSRSGRRLRVALVRAGRILEERVLPRRATLTLGPSELHTFVIAASELVVAIELIRFTSKGRELIVPRGASGAVSTAAEKITLGAALEGHTIALDEESRGRIALGDLTVLFQLTEPPPRRPRAELPASLRSGVEIDWATTVIAAFSFLFHFGIVGSIYSDWLDPLVDDRIVIGEVVESLSSLPSTPRVEEPTPESVAPRAAPAPNRTAERSAQPRSQARADAHRMGPSPEPIGDSRAASLANQLRALDAVVASTLAVGGPSTDDVLSPESRLLDLDGIARENRVASHDSALHFGSEGEGPKRSGDLRDLAHRGGDAVAEAGNAVGPKRASSGRVDLSVGGHPDAFPDAPHVVAGLQGRFHRCYQTGLNKEDPTMRGTMRLTMRIAPNGEVAGTSATSGGSLSANVVSCVQNVATGAHFQAAEGGLGGTLLVPMSFQPQ